MASAASLSPSRVAVSVCSFPVPSVCMSDDSLSAGFRKLRLRGRERAHAGPGV